MNPNLSEEEQVEALKKWWKENGKSVIGGVIIGLGAVFGWRYWNQHQETLANNASMQFEQLSQSLQAGALDSADVQAKAIVESYPGTVYSVLAALSLAKVQLERGDPDGAIAQLTWAKENAKEGALKQIARLRLVRILVSEGQLDAAAKEIAAADNDEFQGEFAELEGDLAIARGDNDAARSAYERALDNQVGNSALVQMKLDDLAANL